MKYPNHLSPTPEQNLLRLTYVGVLSIAKPLEEFATWLLTGVAAILGAVIVNIEAVSKVLSTPNIRWGLALLVISLLAGVVAKQIGVFICAGIALIEEMYSELESGAIAIRDITSSPDEINQEISAPFLPPFKRLMKKSFERGGEDKLAGEKQLVKWYCIQNYVFWLQSIAGAVGLLCLAFGIK
ncbi:MAG: hypothetical protein ACU88J_08735 [Gammaproteobacteria bacterium]